MSSTYFTKKTWLARLGEGLNKFSIGGASPVTIVSSPDSVTQAGDALSATNLNDLESRIDTGFSSVESAISNISTYSTSETVVGTWINGKPIYRQVFIKEGIQSSNFFIGTVAPNSLLIQAFGYGIWPDYSQCRPISTQRYSNTIGVFINQSDGKITVEPQSDSGWYSLCNYYLLVVEYVKL